MTGIGAPAPAISATEQTALAALADTLTPEQMTKLARVADLFVVGSADTTAVLTPAEITDALAQFDAQQTSAPTQQGPTGNQVTGFMWKDGDGCQHLFSLSGACSGEEHWTRLMWAAGFTNVWARSARFGDQGPWGEQAARGHFQCLYDVVYMPSADLAPDITSGRPNEVTAGGLNIYSDCIDPKLYPNNYAPVISIQSRSMESVQLFGSTIIGDPVNPVSQLRSDGSYNNSISLAGIGFITEWTVAGDAAARTVTLPFVSTDSSQFQAYIDWGDGTKSWVTAYDDAARAHTYAADGTYKIEIRGRAEGWSFNNSGDKDKIVKVIYWGSSDAFGGFRYLRYGFKGCSNLTSLGIGSILPADGGPQLLDEIFKDCAITEMPQKLFWLLSNVTSLYLAFHNNELTSLPNYLLDQMIRLTSLYGAFAGNKLTTIPDNFLLKNVLVSNTEWLFSDMSTLAALPANLYRAQPNLLYATGTMATNPSMQLRADMFYNDGEQSTRFLNKVMEWTNAFSRTTFTGTQGTAPDIWNCDFGETMTLDVAPATDWAVGDTITGQTSAATLEIVSRTSALVYRVKKHFGTFTLGEVIGVTGTAEKLADQGAANPTFVGKPVSTGAFGGAGNSVTSISNYASIPASWR